MSNIPLNIDFQQVLLHLLNFAVLFAILYFLLYKPVKSFMDKRKKEYEEMDQQAAEKLDDARRTLEEYEGKLKAADEEIRLKMDQAALESQKHCADLEDQAKLKAQEILDQARSQAETEKDRILDQAGESVVRMASEAARKVVFENSSQAFDEFLKSAEQGK